MTLWEAALDRNPRIAEQATSLESVVDRLLSLDQRGPADIDPRYGRDYLDLVTDPNAVPGGVYGYGLWVSERKTAGLVPALFVRPGLAPAGGAPISVSPIGALLRSFDYSAPAGALAIPLPPPQPHHGPSSVRAVPGHKITIGSRRATLGLRVTTPDTDCGILTAGHAVNPVWPPALGPVVRDESGEEIGRVVFSHELTDVPPGSATADVAVIDVRDGDAWTVAQGPRVDVAKEFDDVSLGNARSWVRGVSPSIAFSRDQGSWAEVAITASAISNQSDSGAPARRGDGAVVGHIVAGYGSAYSLIQDAEYVVNFINGYLR